MQNSILRIILITACVITIVFSIVFIVNSKWSNIDEYAHMDYVERLTAGEMPLFTDTITNKIFEHTIKYPEKSVVGKALTRTELGLANYSYQAQHPPLYYAVLAIPNFIFKLLGLDIFERVTGLRVFSYFLYVCGMLLCISILKNINKCGLSIPINYSWGCVLFGLLIATHERYGLGNNQLSPLFINMAIVFLIKFYYSGKSKTLYLFVLMLCLSVSVALSNLFIIPVLGLIFLIYCRRLLTAKRVAISILICFMFGVMFFLWKIAFVPNKELALFMRNFFEYYIPSGVLGVKTFIRLHLDDMLTMSFISNQVNLFWPFIIVFSLNILLVIIFIKSIISHYRWILIMVLFIVYYVFLQWFLNTYVAGYTWVAFRHYQGMIPFLYFSFTGGFLYLYLRKNNKSYIA